MDEGASDQDGKEVLLALERRCQTKEVSADCHQLLLRSCWSLIRKPMCSKADCGQS